MALIATIGGSGTLFVGEDKTFYLEVLDSDPAINPSAAPINIAGWGILFDVRLRDIAGEPALFSRTATITGVYSATRAANTQRAQVVMTDDELNAFLAKTYRHSWKRMDDGSETVLAWGNFTLQKATAP